MLDIELYAKDKWLKKVTDIFYQMRQQCILLELNMLIKKNKHYHFGGMFMA